MMSWLRQEAEVSGRVASALSRVQAWLDECPAELRAEVEPRIESKDDDQVNSAFFELYLWKILSCGEHGIDVQPGHRLPSGSQPDLTLVRRGRVLAHIECVCFTQVNTQNTRDRLDFVLRNATSYLSCRNFTLFVHDINFGEQQASPKRIARELDRTLAGLDYPACLDQLALGDIEIFLNTAYEIVDSKSGFRLSYSCIPLPLGQVLEDDESPVFMTTVSYGYSRKHGIDLRNQIRNKRKQHKGTSDPIVIAFSIQDFPGDVRAGEVADVLYGQLWGDYRDRSNPKVQRKRDGIWSKSDNYNQIKGVIATSCVMPWMVPNDHLVYWKSFDHTFDSTWWDFESVTPDIERNLLCESPGKSVMNALGDVRDEEQGKKYRRLMDNEFVLYNSIVAKRMK